MTCHDGITAFRFKRCRNLARRFLRVRVLMLSEMDDFEVAFPLDLVAHQEPAFCQLRDQFLAVRAVVWEHRSAQFGGAIFEAAGAVGDGPESSEEQPSEGGDGCQFFVEEEPRLDLSCAGHE